MGLNVLTRYAIGYKSVYSSLEGGLATGGGWFKSFTVADLSESVGQNIGGDFLQRRQDDVGVL